MRHSEDYVTRPHDGARALSRWTTMAWRSELQWRRADDSRGVRWSLHARPSWSMSCSAFLLSLLWSPLLAGMKRQVDKTRLPSAIALSMLSL